MNVRVYWFRIDINMNFLVFLVLLPIRGIVKDIWKEIIPYIKLHRDLTPWTELIILTQTLRNAAVIWSICDNCVSSSYIVSSQLSAQMQRCGGADNSKQQTFQMPFLLGLRIHYANFGQQIYLLYYILLGFILKNRLHSLWMCIYL